MFFIFLIIQFAIMYFLNILGITSEINAYIFILFNMIYVIMSIIVKYSDIDIYLIIAYFSRMLFMVWDIYGRSIFILPGSGNDTEGFYRSAVLISNNIELLKESIYGEVYSKILGTLFHFIGDNRIIGQYINVILGMGIIILIYKCLKMLNIKAENIKIAIVLISLLPNSLIFSSILLRENFITYFVILSVFYFIKWYKKGKVMNQLISIILVMIASSFHSGVVGILIGYMFIYIVYDRKNKRFKLSSNSMIITVVIVLMGIIILSNGDTFLAKFMNVKEADDIVRTSNFRKGGSQYLTFLQPKSGLVILLSSPIKMFYFLTSPLPWDFRSFSDLLTFCIDSIFYLWFIYIIINGFVNRNKLYKNRFIILGLSLSILITVFIFSIGVANAGTAMRHRQKILPVLIVLVIILREELYDIKT